MKNKEVISSMKDWKVLRKMTKSKNSRKKSSEKQYDKNKDSDSNLLEAFKNAEHKSKRNLFICISICLITIIVVLFGISKGYSGSKASNVTVSTPAYSTETATRPVQKVESASQIKSSSSEPSKPLTSKEVSENSNSASSKADIPFPQTASSETHVSSSLPILPSEELPQSLASSYSESLKNDYAFATKIISEKINKVNSKESVIYLNFVFKNVGEPVSWKQKSDCKIFQGTNSLSLVCERNASAIIARGGTASVQVGYLLNNSTDKIKVEYRSGKNVITKFYSISKD